MEENKEEKQPKKSPSKWDDLVYWFLIIFVVVGCLIYLIQHISRHGLFVTPYIIGTIGLVISIVVGIAFLLLFITLIVKIIKKFFE